MVNAGNRCTGLVNATTQARQHLFNGGCGKVEMLNQSELIETIKRRHPTLCVSPVSDYSGDYRSDQGVWLRGDSSNEDVDTPVFYSTVPYEDGYESGLSVVFAEWLKANGWGYECFDYGSYWLLPNSVS